MKRKLFLIMVIALLLLISSIPVSAKNLSKYQTVKIKEKTRKIKEQIEEQKEDIKDKIDELKSDNKK